MSSTEAEVRQLLSDWSEAVGLKDIDRLMALYSPDVVYFDVVPPLKISGSDAVRRNFLRWFEAWESGIGSEVRELQVGEGGDVAVAHHLHRTSGTLKGGRKVDYWVRVTVACRRSDKGWRIFHEHVSLPIDMATRSAVMDLTP